jgi:hypothetical protein
MQKEKLEEVSGGAAVALQAFVMFFITPFFLLIAYFLLKVPFTVGVALFLLIIICVDILLIRYSMRYGDIYINNNAIVIKKIIGTKNKPITDYKSVEEALLPNDYIITFVDGTKVYFKLKAKDFLNRLNSGSDISKIIMERFNERRDSIQ